MKKMTNCEILTRVTQLIQVDSIKTANNLIKDGNWVLINSYYNRAYKLPRPVYTLGYVGK